MLQTPLQITVCCPPLAAPHSPPLPPTSHLTLHLPSPSSPKSVPLASLLYPLPALFFFPSSFSFVLDLPLSPPFNSLFSLSHFLPFFTPPPPPTFSQQHLLLNPQIHSSTILQLSISIFHLPLPSSSSASASHFSLFSLRPPSPPLTPLFTSLSSSSPLISYLIVSPLFSQCLLLLFSSLLQNLYL